MTTIFKRRTLLSLALAATVLTPGIAHADALSDIETSGKIRISIDPAAPPYSSLDASGQYVGSEVDFAEKLAADWGVEAELVPTSAANRIPYLQTNRTDVVISTLSITEERRQVIDFSRPYSAIQIVVGGPADSGAESLQDLVGKRVAVVRGSTNDSQITADALDGTDIVRFEDDSTAITALLSGQADFYVTAPALLTTVNAQNPRLDVRPLIVLETNVTGIGVAKGQDALRDKLDAWVADGIADGSLNEIYRDAFGIDLPPEVTAWVDQ
ncbi:transporter substrate-binding domain-containing protein [Pelagibacterium sp. H642]|uniref:transporter substrate-binding domain-containing protein n=1 Tax=Pelagibacterium sp. H642 TaxID=1881069 RepID=UPI002814FF82|nr:transporter substrate-binding domain-containing protein [Pelagibacterium sp. H642]WMT91893.1 transporter substrate-binding domain-containing protein [Pelagibacterium sp. H642]